MREPAQRQDEEDAGDQIGQRGEIGAHDFFCFLWNMASMRCVTIKPPKILTEAKAERDEAERARPDRPGIIGDERHADREQRADHDDRGDGVGHRHQRRVQRRRHRPHDVVADEDREHEDRQAEHERIDRVGNRVDRAAAGGGNNVELCEDRESHHDRPPSALRRAFRLEARMHDGAVAGERRRLDDIVVPIDRQRLGLLVDQDFEEGVEILGVET